MNLKQIHDLQDLLLQAYQQLRVVEAEVAIMEHTTDELISETLDLEVELRSKYKIDGGN